MVVAVVCLYAMLWLIGLGEDTGGVALREGDGSRHWGNVGKVKAIEAVRETTVPVLTTGNAADAMRAATQTACR